MKTAFGRKYWAHSLGSPVEDVIISSHGWRDGADPRRINLLSPDFKGVELHFLQPDGSPLNTGVQHVIAGKMRPVDVYNSTNPNPYDYMLRKWQGARHGGGNESYSSIGDALNRQASGPNAREMTRKIKDLMEFKEGRMTEADKVGWAGDTLQRDVISIRSGGRYRQQTVWLSDLILAARAAKPHYRVFICSFCRVVV